MSPNQSQFPQYEVCILAGGLSLRMGHDKARLRLGRRTLLGHVRTTALSLGLPVRVIRRDRVRRCGPLGGIYTALAVSRANAFLFLSCDMPFASADMIRELMNRVRPSDRALFVAEKKRAGFPFILRRDALPIVEELLAARQFSLQRLAGRLDARRVRVPRRYRSDLLNINTSADWIEAKRRWNNRPPIG